MSNLFGPSCHAHGIRGYGDPSHGVLIVGIAPGRDEINETKRPFTGDSGKLLDKLLAFSGWSRDKTYCTNVICWWNNRPSEEDQTACRERFQRELRLMKPKLIITAGEIASYAVMGHKRRKGSRGSVIWSDRWGCYVLDTHHPSAVLQGQSMTFAQDIIRDFTKIERVLSWPPEAKHAEVAYHTAESLREAQYILDNLPRDGRPVTLDIETSNPDIEDIDAFTDQLVTLAISYDANDGQEINWVFPTRIFPACVRDGTHLKSHRAGQPCPVHGCPVGHYPSPLVWPTNGVHWTFQVGQYDVPGIFNTFGYMLKIHDDTMLMSYCTDERPGYHGLKQNGREWLGLGWWEEKTDPYKRKGRIDQAPPDDVEEYNATDAAATKRLVPIHLKRMREDGTEGLYRNLLLPAIQTFTAAQIRGINIDQKRLQELAYDNWFPKYLEEFDHLQSEAQRYGWQAEFLNFDSNPQMRKFFFEILKLSPTKFSKKTSLPSVDKETLDKMDHPFAAELRAYRTLDTTVGYVLSLQEHTKWDGKIHPSGFVTTTRNGRTSYRNPPAQTWPKDYTVGADYARIRETIIPHNPETHVIGEFDFNQIEVWMAWFRSQDPVLYEHLTSGDVHSATAEGAFNLSRHNFTKEAWSVYRQNAKKIRFGLGYGEGAEGLSRPPPVGIGGTRAAAQIFINNFWNTYQGHRRWNEATQREIYKKGYLTSASGRIMRFPIILDHKALRQAINFPISADASDCNLTSMIELFHPDNDQAMRDLECYFLINVHDSLVTEIHRDRIPETVAYIKGVMQKPRFPGYPSIRVDVKIGDSLGTVREYHD